MNIDERCLPYAADNESVSSFVADSGEGGSLVVGGSGFLLIVR